MARQSPALLPARFLRTEAFYVLVVLFVVAVHVMQGVQSLRLELARDRVDVIAPAPAGYGLGQNTDLKLLRRAALSITADWNKNRRAALFPLWVERLQILLMITGAALALLLALMALINMRYPKVDIFVRPAWSLWDCFKAAACWSAGGLLFGIIFDVDYLGPDFTTSGAVAAVFVAILTIGIVIHIAVGERGMRLQDLGLRADRIGQALLAAVAAFLILQPILWIIEAAQSELFKELPIHNTLEILLRSRSTAVITLTIVAAVVVVPVAEEIFFRGMLQPALQKWFGPWSGLLLCAAFFTGVHKHIYVIAPLFVLGVALGYIYNRTRSLAAPIALHILSNGLAVLTVLSYRQILSP